MAVYLPDLFASELVLFDQKDNIPENSFGAKHLGLVVAELVAEEKVESARDHLSANLRNPGFESFE